VESESPPFVPQGLIAEQGPSAGTPKSRWNLSSGRRLESVDDWPLAIATTRHSGAGLGRHPLSGVVYQRYPPPEAHMSQFSAGTRCPTCLCGGPRLGELSGGNWMVAGPASADHPVAGRLARPFLYLLCTPSGVCPGRPPLAGWRSPRFKIDTWLILPVVICLSQRLSHACLSISNYTVKLRMAH
jgi:hypothetical protein